MAPDQLGELRTLSQIVDLLFRLMISPGDSIIDFEPTFGSGFVPPIRIARSAYVLPRYASLVNFDTANNDGIATRCTGF